LFTSSSFLKTYAHPIYHTTKSIPTLLSSLLIPISILDGLPEVSHFTASSIGGLLTPPDSSLHILPSLSELALSLLIAAARLSIIHSTDTTNFPLAYAEYVSLASKARMNSAASGALASGAGTRVFGKEVARREWEKLVGYGLLVPVASGAFGLGGTVSAAGTGGAEKGMEMVRVDVALEEIPLSVEMSAVMEKWCLQI
jgi:origin recognition complex subunit 4